MRLLRPDVTCPACGRTPRLRIAEAEREAHSDDPPDRTVVTVQCHRCHRVYPVPAAAYQRAA